MAACARLVTERVVEIGVLGVQADGVANEFLCRWAVAHVQVRNSLNYRPTSLQIYQRNNQIAVEAHENNTCSLLQANTRTTDFEVVGVRVCWGIRNDRVV